METFEDDRFRIDLLSELGKVNIEENENGLHKFLDGCKRILNIRGQRKQKHAKGSHIAFIKKALSR